MRRPSPLCRQHRLLAGVVTLLVVLPALLTTVRVVAAPLRPVAITEVAWMGSDLSASDEWLELTSFSQEAIDIGGWSVTSLKSTGEQATIATFPPATLLEPGMSVVIARLDAGQSVLAYAPLVQSSSVSLPNSKLRLQLLAADGTVIDEADDGVGDPVAGSNVSGAKATMERSDPFASGADAASWKTASQSQGFDTGVLMLGTPGEAQIVQVVTQQSSSVSSAIVTVSSSSASEQGSSVTQTVATLRISELLPNPVGTDDAEWIELALDTPGSLEGWKLVSGTKTHALHGSGSGDILLLFKETTGISLSNSGGDVRLLYGQEERDRLSYAASHEGVSIGKTDDGAVEFCVPTPGEPNAVIAPEIRFGVQSGSLEGQEKATFNLTIEVVSGTLEDAECFVDFDDGSSSDSCNPPSHTIDEQGTYIVRADVRDVCGNSVTTSVIVHVDGSTSSASSSSRAATSIAIPDVPAADAQDILLYAAMPNPQGNDAQTGEWVKIASTVPVKVALVGFTLVLGEKRFPLDSVVLEPETENVIQLKSLGASLVNTAGSVALLFGETDRGTISWTNAREGIEYHVAPEGMREYAKALRVIDGDTVEVLRHSGRRETVRLRGIDAPELQTFFRESQEYANESKELLGSLIEGKNIELQFDTEMHDAYGRTLAYIHDANGEDVQRLLLDNGFARVPLTIEFSRRTSYEAVEQAAKEHGRGLWRSFAVANSVDFGVAPEVTEVPSVGMTNIRISEIFPSPAKGEEEWIELFNAGDEAVVLDGWTLAEESPTGRRSWVIPQGATIPPEEYFSVLKSGAMQLNNGGQEVLLVSPSGVADRVTYPTVATGKSYALADGTLCLAKPTKNLMNHCDTTVKQTPKKTSQSAVQQLFSGLTTVYEPGIPEEEEEPETPFGYLPDGAKVFSESLEGEEEPGKSPLGLLLAGMGMGAGLLHLLRRGIFAIV